MKVFERGHVRQMLDLILSSTGMRIIAATGPRQAGKTTVALQACNHLTKLGYVCWYIPIDEPEHDSAGRTGATHSIRVGRRSNEATLINIWKDAREVSQKSDRGLVLVLDEIQVIPRWSNIVKGLWDRDRRDNIPLRPVILGSASWGMLTGINESLAGRFINQQINHWSYQEITELYQLTVDEYIFFGGYPGSFLVNQDGVELDFWHNYISNSIVRPVVDRDLIGLNRIRKPALMRQLIDLAPHYSGQLISYNKLLGQLQDRGNATTIAHYLDLLSDAGLMAALSRYTPTPHIGKASSPKLNVLNTALMTVVSGYSFPAILDYRPNYWGRIVESAVGAHLLNTRGTRTRVHYWRNPPHEVDFVICRGHHLLGIEVKSGKSSKKHGLDAFKVSFPNAKTMTVGPNGIPLSVFFSLTTDEWLEEKK